jgi:hypothetical protein
MAHQRYSQQNIYTYMQHEECCLILSFFFLRGHAHTCNASLQHRVPCHSMTPPDACNAYVGTVPRSWTEKKSHRAEEDTCCDLHMIVQQTSVLVGLDSCRIHIGSRNKLNACDPQENKDRMALLTECHDRLLWGQDVQVLGHTLFVAVH